MLEVSYFCQLIKNYGSSFYAGVPDSLLKDLCAYISDKHEISNHICANEGSAVALVSGYHLSTKKIGIVYMQNSGMGNAINPLLSLADVDVYSIPMLLIIGWRGEPGKKDEPQHKKQGIVTLDLLKTLRVPYQIIDSETSQIEKIIDYAYDYMKSTNSPYALVVRDNTFEKYNFPKTDFYKYELSREEAIITILDYLTQDDVIVSTTGKASRELLEYRNLLQKQNNRDFLTVGSMGHASQIALGIAMSKPDLNIFCVDGDGAVIMHMGALAISGTSDCCNFKHIVINNGVHESVGGQPTVGFKVEFTKIAKACGYKNAFLSKSASDLKRKLKILKSCEGPAFLEIRVNQNSRTNLSRPTLTPVESKLEFMELMI